jgi:hypothetical protein
MKKPVRLNNLFFQEVVMPKYIKKEKRIRANFQFQSIDQDTDNTVFSYILRTSYGLVSSADFLNRKNNFYLEK